MRTLLVVFLTIIFHSAYGQTEFEEYENGLIYSPLAMSKLAQIVDSENQQFRICDFSKTFKSLPQATGYLFEIDSKKNPDLKLDLKSNISLEEFLIKYNQQKGNRVLAVKHEYKNYEDDPVVEIELYVGNNSFHFDKKESKQHYFGNWIVDFRKKEPTRVMYTSTSLEAKPIPDLYGRMIQYTECLIDTTTTVFKENAVRSGVRYNKKKDLKNQQELIDFIKMRFETDEPSMEDYGEDYNMFYTDLNLYEKRRDQFIEETLSSEGTFKRLLQLAYEEAVNHGTANWELENYVANYLSKEKALDLKRSRIVVGGCSQDQAPRIHAMNIAQLSAESYSWDVFLRAHLDIMNDRFQRASDGSYAWRARNTYIKELEELNINVKDLLLGITLRVDNPSQNHYFGSIRRLGRAISESKDLVEMRTEILEGISNQELDDYNRLMFFYLYANLQYNEDLAVDKEFDKAKVEKVRSQLPIYLQTVDY